MSTALTHSFMSTHTCNDPLVIPVHSLGEFGTQVRLCEIEPRRPLPRPEYVRPCVCVCVGVCACVCVCACVSGWMAGVGWVFPAQLVETKALLVRLLCCPFVRGRGGKGNTLSIHTSYTCMHTHTTHLRIPPPPPPPSSSSLPPPFGCCTYRARQG